MIPVFLDSNFRARRHYGVMEYIYDLNKKTSEIPRNPTSSKWSENFWSCLQVIRQVLNNKQKFDIVFLGFIALAHLQVLCPLPKERSPLWYLFVYIYLCINIYIYIIHSSTCIKRSPSRILWKIFCFRRPQCPEWHGCLI